MDKNKPETPRRHWSVWASWLVLALSLVITLAAWNESRKIADNLLKSEFEALIGETRAKLDDRIVSYTQVLRSAAALFAAAGPDVSRGEWKSFIETQQLDRNYPAIPSVAFARSVKEAELEKFVAEMQRSGIENFALRPPGRRERYVINAYAEPFTGGNVKALGYDMWQDADRRMTMERAAASGEPMITQRLTLRIDEKTNPVPAFIMYLPVRFGGELYGYVLSPFRMPTLLQDLLGRNAGLITLDIYDGTEPAQDKLFYRSDNGEDATTPRLTERQTLEIGGRKWTLEFSTRNGLVAKADSGRPYSVLAIGLTFSLLLFIITWSLGRTRARAEAIAEEMTRSLSKSRNLLQGIVDNSPALIYLKDLQGRYLFVNKAWYELFHTTSENVNGKTDLELFPEEIAGRFMENDRNALESGKPLDIEEVALLEDGRHYYQGTKIAIRDHDGKIYGLCGISTDMTARKKAEQEHLDMEKQLLHAQKLESLGVLAGGIAHDFNNILMAIIGNADLALMRINKESPATENLHRIEQAASRAADLAKQMLAYSGKGKFVVENIDLNILLEEMLHMLEVSISKKAVLRFNLQRPLPSVEADATQMRQIIMNLVINASEAIGDQNGMITITTGSIECDKIYLKDVWLDENITEGEYVYFEIADSGCGMDKETLSRLFDPFFTTKFTGRGLGMAAVLGIVRGHKGAIKVYSEPDRGTTFKILFPASAGQVELADDRSHRDDWLGSGTVLLVDDEETVRAIGAEMLKELGFTTVTANDGLEALEVFKRRDDIAFVILDLTMPHMDGEQCFRELRQLNPDVKVMISSGYSEQEVATKFAGKGLSGFIQKPYRLSVLKEAVRGIV